jgi:hypothetical protein
MKGWKYPGGFFSVVRKEGEAAIPGYAEDNPKWRQSFYNFTIDRKLRNRLEAEDNIPLPEVCSDQWANAHTEILASRRELDCEVLRVRFEDVVSDPVRSLTEMCSFLRREPSKTGLEYAKSLFPKSVVMGTSRAGNNASRWRSSDLAEQIHVMHEFQGIKAIEEQIQSAQ